MNIYIITSGVYDLLCAGYLRSSKSSSNLLSLCQIAFAAADSVTGLKLVETGLPKEKIALMALVMVPLQIVLPWIIRSLVTVTLSRGCTSHYGTYC